MTRFVISKTSEEKLLKSHNYINDDSVQQKLQIFFGERITPTPRRQARTAVYVVSYYTHTDNALHLQSCYSLQINTDNALHLNSRTLFQ